MPTFNGIRYSPKKTCCFTGSRPKNLLPNSSDPYAITHENKVYYSKIKALLTEAIEEAYNQGYRRFITGMAQGVDMIAFFIVDELKKKHSDIDNICFMPFIGQENKWSEEGFFNKNVYDKMINTANEIYVISVKESNEAYISRNRKMVEQSSLLISLHNKELSNKSGTFSTMKYAKSMNVRVKEIIV